MTGPRSPWHLFPVVIVASGDSLTDQQCELIRKRIRDDAIRCVVINDNFKRVPEAHVIYACDAAWWRCRSPSGLKYTQLVTQLCPKIERWSCDNQCAEFGCNIVKARSRRMVGKEREAIAPADDPAIIRFGSGGGQAIGMVIKWGARHIVLVGFDGKRAANGKAHWFGDHPVDQLRNPQPFGQWARDYDDLAAPAEKLGIRIAQCSIDTATTKLIRSTLEEEIGT